MLWVSQAASACPSPAAACVLLYAAYAMHRYQHSLSLGLMGVRHFMLVVAMMCSRNASTSVMLVLMATLFSHSNSAHMLRNCETQAGAARGM